MSRVLVYQSNSVQGNAVLEHARQAGLTVRALIRNTAKASFLKQQGFEVVEADLLESKALIDAHESVDFVIAQIPAYSDSFAACAIKNSIAAMRQHKIKGAVLKMANPTPDTDVPDTGFSVNSNIVSEMNSSGIPFTVVEPTMYLDTLLKPNIKNEIATLSLIDLPIDADLKIAWTCVDDAARLSVSLLKEGAFGLTVRCAGDHSYSGTGLANIFASVLGKSMVFKSTDIGKFQQELEAAIGIEKAKPVISKFRFLAEHPKEAQAMLGVQQGEKPTFKATTVLDWIESNKKFFIQEC